MSKMKDHEEIKSRVLALLADGKPHSASWLHFNIHDVRDITLHDVLVSLKRDSKVLETVMYTLINVE